MKVSIIMDQELSIGLIANCAAVLGTALGARQPDLLGPNLSDQSGTEHQGITTLPLPILSASQERLQELMRAGQSETSLTVIAFNHVAQSCKTYADYQEKLSQTSFHSLKYLGILIAGPNRAVARLTGSLPLLR